MPLATDGDRVASVERVDGVWVWRVAVGGRTEARGARWDRHSAERLALAALWARGSGR